MTKIVDYNMLCILAITWGKPDYLLSNFGLEPVLRGEEDQYIILRELDERIALAKVLNHGDHHNLTLLKDWIHDSPFYEKLD